MPLVTLKEDFQGYKAGAQRVPEHIYRAARQANVLTTADDAPKQKASGAKADDKNEAK